VDLVFSSICFIGNKHTTILESIGLFDHLFKAHVVDVGQANVRTFLSTRNTGCYDGINGLNELPLVLDGERLPEQWLASFSGHNSSDHNNINEEEPKSKN